MTAELFPTEFFLMVFVWEERGGPNTEPMGVSLAPQPPHLYSDLELTFTSLSIWSQSDELIESYDISDQDPQRVNISFLRRHDLAFSYQLALRQFFAVPGLRGLDLLP
jgi:hypothetical protein